MKTFAVEVEYLEEMPSMFYKQKVDLIVAAEDEAKVRENLAEAYKEAPNFQIKSVKEEGEAPQEIVDLMKQAEVEKGKLN